MDTADLCKSMYAVFAFTTARPPLDKIFILFVFFLGKKQVEKNDLPLLSYM